MKVVGRYINVELNNRNYKIQFELTLDLGFFIDYRNIGGKVVFQNHPFDDATKTNIHEDNVYKISICFSNRKYLTQRGIYKSLELIIKGERTEGYYIVPSKLKYAEDLKCFSSYHEIELEDNKIISIIKNNLKK